MKKYAVLAVFFMSAISLAQNGLVAHWSFDEGTGNVAHDTFGDNALIIGATNWTTGRFGSALFFDGTSGQLNVNNTQAIQLNNQFTLCGWINGNLDGYFFGLHTLAYKGTSYYVGVSDAHVYGRIFTNQWCPVRGATRLNNNQWYHIAITYDKNDGGQVTNDITQFDGLRLKSLACPDSSAQPTTSGPIANWDTNHREIGNVLYEPDDPNPDYIYKAWYTGYFGNTYIQNQVYVGMYTSPDGIHWTNRGQISTLSLEDPYVVHYNGVYYLFAENKDEWLPNTPVGNIKRIHSTDLVNWIDDGNVISAKVGGLPYNWQAQDVGSPVVWIENDIWHLLYEARGYANAGAIGVANSLDGLLWTQETSPVMFPAHDGTWDSSSMVPDDLLKLNGVYYFIYHANGTQQVGTWSGIATSADFHHWTKYDKNPFDTHDTLMVSYVNGELTFFAEDQGQGINEYRPVTVSAPRLYINGIEDKYWQRTDANNRSINVANTMMSIGNSPAGTPFYFQGTIDDVRIYNRALTSVELQQIGTAYYPKGDMNCDGVVNNFDIDPFVMAILQPDVYASVYTNCNILNGDIDNNGVINNFDIDPFVGCIFGQCP